LKRQTCKDFIWLIIDDGSTDNTREMVDKWIDENEINIKYYFQENQGMSGAHNTAYELIDTDLNVCIDSDDYMADDAIEKIIKFWNQHGSDKVSGIIALNATTDNQIIGTRLPSNINTSRLNDLYLRYECTGDKKLIYRTDLIKKYPYPIFKGEKYMPLNYKYALLDLEYEMLLMNDVVCFVEYMTDGSSMNIIRQYKRNPRSFSEYRKIYVKMSNKPVFRFKQYIHYVATSLIAKDKEFIKKSTNRIIVTIALLPGVLLYLYISNTRRSGFMKQ
jgi:glycosyltransferase involved in cell wall biosynthesis